MALTVGVLALQGGFLEHLSLLQRASVHLKASNPTKWKHLALSFIEVRNSDDLSRCEALIIPGGESTTIAFIAAQCHLLEPLRHFAKIKRKPTWGTCAGLILLSEQANATKKGGQELIGGLDVRVQRNHFGRQVESFIADVDLAFLPQVGGTSQPYPGVFIRAPIVEELLKTAAAPPGAATDDRERTPTDTEKGTVQVLAVLPDRSRRVYSGREADKTTGGLDDNKANDIVAVRQGNILGTSFHPELTDDIRMHVWWLEEVVSAHNSTNS